jgi:hypothetical protein
MLIRSALAEKMPARRANPPADSLSHRKGNKELEYMRYTSPVADAGMPARHRGFSWVLVVSQPRGRERGFAALRSAAGRTPPADSTHSGKQ